MIEKYPDIKKDGDKLVAEIFIPHFHNGSGTYLWFTASPLFDSAGKITGAIESIREITARKRAEEELVMKNEELNASYRTAIGIGRRTPAESMRNLPFRNRC